MAPRRPLAVLASVAALAGWLDFSRLQESHHADSLVPVLAGLTAWTPFYWGQDRYGMLIPLLALPVRSPAAHLLLQGFLAIGLAAWGLVLLVRTLLPRSVEWAPAAALLLCLLLLLAPAEQRFNVLWVQPYTLSFALGLSAVALLHRPGALGLGAASVLFLAAAWVNVSVGVVVGPLVLWRSLFTDTGRLGLERLRFTLTSLVLLALATFCSARLSQAVALPHTPTERLPAAAWAGAATVLFHNASSEPAIRRWVGVALGLAALGLLSLGLPRVRHSARPVLLAAAGLALTATLPFALASASQWVAQNGFPLRYLVPSLLLLEAALCLLATLPLLALPRDVHALQPAASVAAVGLAALLAVGPPSGAAVVHAFEARWGAAARDVINARATHVTGDYWKVWPTVFYASWLLGDGRQREWPYGVTDRSSATLAEARRVAHPRVAALDGHAAWLGLLGPRPWRVEERWPTCLLLTAP
jgi:hypothetical protein